jgi:4-hydroxy-tetrahydrodipicolinate reductase
MTGYRVVQWATGNIGTRALRAVIEHPDMELVGVYVHSGAKAGRDAGELCGTAPTGVVATQDIDAIVDLGADCALYMPQGCNVDDLCRLLGSGTNVVTTRGEFHRPASVPPDDRSRIEAACERGQTSIHSTGSSPGFITEALPIVLTSLQRRLDCLTVDEFADLTSRDSPDLLFRVMGFGAAPEAFDTRRFAYGRHAFGPSLELLGDALSAPLDAVEATGSVAVARRPIEIAAGVLGAGTVAAQRMEVTGVRGGQPFLRFRASWYCTTDIEPAWDLRETGWRVRVDGDTPLDVDIRFPVPAERYASVSPGYTAHRAVNAIPSVCAAAPGIRTTVDLPQVIANLA